MTRRPTPHVHRGARPALRLGLLVDAGGLERWQEAMLSRLSGSDARVVAVIVDSGTVVGQPGRSVAPHVWAAYRRLRLVGRGRALARRPLPRPPTVTPAEIDLEGDGRRPYRLAHDALTVLGDARCDAVVNFTGRDVAAVPDTVCPFGLWEYRASAMTDGQRRHLRTLQPTLVELTFARIVDDADDDIIERGWIYSVPQSVAQTIDEAYFTAVDWLAKICRVVVSTGSLPAAGRPTPGGALVRGAAMSSVVAGSAWRKLRWKVRRAFLQEQWQVGVVDQPIESLLDEHVVPRPRWLPNPKGCYLADPFGAGDSDAVLVEQYDYRTRKGHIAVVDTSQQSPSPTPVDGVSSAGHLSYPFLLRYDGTIYCIPESGDDQRAVLYRARRFPHEWEPLCTVVEGLAVIDPTLVSHDGRWWLFCTDGELGSESNLHVFHARSLTGPWTPHMRNPVKVDVRSSRPAGTPFVVDGLWIRPAQSHAHGYGSGVVFNVIDALSEEDFNERPVAHLDPSPDGPLRDGVHTVSAWGDRTLVDGKRNRTTVASAVGRLRAVVGR